MTDAELRALIRELIHELLPQLPASKPTPPPCMYRASVGAVTERAVSEAGRAGATTIVLCPGAVLTPLAKDRARALGLTVTKES